MCRFPSNNLSAWTVGSAPSASPAVRNGNDSSTLSAVRNSSGAPRGVPELSVVRLTTPLAAWSANALSGSKNLSACGRRASAPFSFVSTDWIASGKTAAAAITLGRFLSARQRSVAGVAAAIDQQQVECDDAGFEAGDFVNEAGALGARQRVAA